MFDCHGVKRIGRMKNEFEDIKKYEKKFSLKIDPDSTNIWFISFQGEPKTLYEKETFTLRFKFDPEYVRYKFFYYLIKISHWKDLK